MSRSGDAIILSAVLSKRGGIKSFSMKNRRNVRCDHGAPVLFSSILRGDVSLVRLVLEHGGRIPNFIGEEPGHNLCGEAA